MTQNNSQPNQKKHKQTNFTKNLDLFKIVTQSESNLSFYLLRTVITVALLPLIIVSSIAYQIIHQSAEERINQQLIEHSLLTSQMTDELLTNALNSLNAIAENPYVISSVLAAEEKIRIDNLFQLNIKELEERFAATKLLQTNQIFNDYLKSTAKNNGFGEIFITEKNGFNVAYSKSTSDFVQRDESWWQLANSQNKFIGESSFDESANSFSFPLVHSIREPKSGKFLGVIKAVLPFQAFNQIEAYLKYIGLNNTEQIQIIDTSTQKVIKTISKSATTEQQQPNLIGGEEIATVATFIKDGTRKNLSSTEIINQLPNRSKLQKLSIKEFGQAKEKNFFIISFLYQEQVYQLLPIPNSNLVGIVSINNEEIVSAGNEIIGVFLLIAMLLLLGTTVIIILLARQIASPIKDLVDKAEQVAAGDLNIIAEPQGTIETRTLAFSFNNLVTQVKQLLSQQNESLQELEQARQQAELFAHQQQEKNENLQQELLELLGDVDGAASGDLTVRSRINEGEIGIVADFFNAIIESLREVVSQVKQAATKVNTSIGKDQGAIELLAEEALQQTEKIGKTLMSVEQMTRSIQQVADNAQTAAQVTQLAATKAETGGASMERTVSSILQLRQTIDETAEKVKSLGDASQQISRVISLINQIAMQTNLLAINASIEAARAGAEGKGFAVVAEEVGELATQSAQATKEVEKILAKIQKETAQVVEAMAIGTTQVVEGTRLAEDTKQSLEQIVQISRQIDELVQSISSATVSQAETSQTVAQLMEQVARVSDHTSTASRQVSSSLENTVAIARQLQASVNTFKTGNDE
ncbi:methyl-accepting chemotaxis sensory transducer [Stanieria cyanosphaera PCC 7437]|uniref:Methyl-accepting chemotaxis sensory transducer n=1 Tax=Stanieria cyanosphaera (strain ATCC 29371 / PCC 7437) TaxID=111780 RepID=K9XZ68_STAC7|nr:methyl-accepting chemotaxis protein [Stanieria cyanosphaera]AFZ37895.1 methyl-accepting chemotaxis sensory transducer [Stanieria cyanosphaera PCC 7437]